MGATRRSRYLARRNLGRTLRGPTPPPLTPYPCTRVECPTHRPWVSRARMGQEWGGTDLPWMGAGRTPLPSGADGALSRALGGTDSLTRRGPLPSGYGYRVAARPRRDRQASSHDAANVTLVKDVPHYGRGVGRPAISRADFTASSPAPESARLSPGARPEPRRGSRAGTPWSRNTPGQTPPARPPGTPLAARRD